MLECKNPLPTGGGSGGGAKYGGQCVGGHVSLLEPYQGIGPIPAPNASKLIGKGELG